MTEEILTTIYIEGTAIALILGLLIIRVPSKELRKQKIEEGIFSRLCFLTIFAAFAELSHDWINTLNDSVYFLPGLMVGIHFVRSVCCMALALQWLIYVDYTLYQNRDHIKRRYPKLILLSMGINLIILVIYVACRLFYPDSADVFSNAFETASGLIELICILQACIMTYSRQREKEIPMFLRLDPFIICLFAGHLASVFSPYPGYALGAASGMVLMYFARMNQICYLDPETGFYNRAYLEYVTGHVRSKGLRGGVGILFRIDGDPLVVSELLSEEKPDNSDIIRMGGNEYLLAALTQPESAVRLLIANVEDAGEEKGLSVQSRYVIRKEGESREEAEKRLREGKIV